MSISRNPLSALEELDRFLKEWTSTPIGRRSFLASLPVLLTACAAPQQHRQREGDNSGQQISLTVEDERNMTREVMPEMQKDYPALPNMEMQNYVSAIGRKLVLANGLEGHPYNYNFTVVGVKQVNAFALPAGTVFVTAPLVAMADNEAELAGVIGHEIGHVKARHAAERMDRAKKEQSKSWLFGAGGGVLGAAAGFGLGKLICKKDDKKCLVTATGLGAAAGVGGGLLIQKYGFMANSREDEMEADRVGFRTAVKAGYDKHAAGSFYAKLLKMEEARKQNNVPVLGSLTDALSTHPPSQERVAQMQQLAAESNQAGKAVVSTKMFDKMKAKAEEWTKQQS